MTVDDMNRALAILFLALALVAFTHTVAAQSQQDRVAARLPNIDKLINRSSGALQVIDSESSDAKLKRQAALELLLQKRRFIL